jgi:hypothetical protein
MMPTGEDFRVTLRAGSKGLNTHPKPLSRSIAVNFIAKSADIRAKTIGCRCVAP